MKKKTIMIILIFLTIICIASVAVVLTLNLKKGKPEPTFKVSTYSDQTKKEHIKYSAPVGGKGKITIPIDIRECEEDIKYKIIVDLNSINNNSNNCDDLYFDNLDVINGYVMKTGTIDIDESSDKVINVDLIYRTATMTDVSVKEYEQDIDIRVVTSPVNERTNPNISKTNLLDVVQVGDYVDYDANSNGEQVYTNDKENYTTNKNKSWRVFSVNKETKEILLTSDIGWAELRGTKGYKDIVEKLNNICAIYGKGKYADLGRSIKVEDIENNTTYNKNEYITEKSKIKYGEISDAYNIQGGKAKQTSYSYNIDKYVKDPKFIDTLFNDTLFASPCVEIDDTHTAFIRMFNLIKYPNKKCRLLSTSSISYKDDIEIDGDYNSSCSGRVVAIVKLKNGVQTTGKNEIGVWNLCD